MGSGHNRGGRGNNRRSRNGPPQRAGRGPQYPQHMNGQRNGQSGAATAISPHAHPPQPSHADTSATAGYEAKLDVVEVDAVEAVERDEGESVVEVREVRAELRAAPPPTVGHDGPPADSAVADSAVNVVEERGPAPPERPAQPQASRGQRQPYVPAMPTGRQGPPPARPPAHSYPLASRPPEAPRLLARAAEADDEGAEQVPPRPRPERFVVAERPRREHGERYQHVPGMPDVRGEVGALIDSLRTLFQEDRTVASQSGATRCGICYFHFPLSALVYHEDGGFYVCQRCAKSLGGTPLHMVRRQQRL